MSDFRHEAVRDGRTPRLASILDEAGPKRRTPTAVAAGMGASLVHLGLFTLALGQGGRVTPETGPLPVSSTRWVEVDLPEPTPHEASPKPLPVVPAPPVPAHPPSRNARPKAQSKSKVAPPPAAAEAGRVLTAPSEAVDFGEAFVMGESTTYAGGTTEKGGTSKTSVRDAGARAGGVEGGTGDDLDTDLSRPPKLAGRTRWDCPFPREADLAGVDRASVGLRVEVDDAGRVKSVEVTSDPGYGFGREARRCASRKGWEPGRDRAGRARAAIAMVNVRFVR